MIYISHPLVIFAKLSKGSVRFMFYILKYVHKCYNVSIEATLQYSIIDGRHVVTILHVSRYKIVVAMLHAPTHIGLW